MKTYVTGELSEQGSGGTNLDEDIKRGIAASEAGDKTTAEAIFRQIVSRSPDALEAWVWLGWTSASLDDSEAAFARASTLAPDNEEAQLGLRWVASQRGSQPQVEAQSPPQAGVASPVVDAAAGNQAEQPSAGVETALPDNLPFEDAMRRAVAAAQAGDKPTAYTMFRQIALRHPNAAQVWVWCGGTSPTLDEAEHAFKQAQRLDPTNEEANLGMRWVALRRQAARHTGDAAAVSMMDTASLNSGTLATPQTAAYDARTATSESAAPATEKQQDAKSGKEQSFFARLLSKLNIPLPVILLFCAVIVVYAVVAVVYLSN
ncbi:MAG TPA: tetratricopeptide repeat protein [Chloroflexia bacterium]|nr:tetratricopeptide repeat protein [Chloroflexia bacterium]